MDSQIKILSRPDLKKKGIRWSRQHLQRLVTAGKFPKPVKLGPQTVGFLEHEIDAWIVERAKERDAAA